MVSCAVRALCLIQAAVMLPAQLFCAKADVKVGLDRAAFSLTADRCTGFDPVGAGDLEISREEKERCRAWYDAHIRAGKDPAYDLTVGGRSLRKHPEDWEISIGAESAAGETARGGKTTVISLRHRLSPVEARVEAVIFEEHASCCWTVYIVNAGGEPSPVIKKFYAADCVLDTGKSEVFFSRGSDSKKDDFELLRSNAGFTPMMFGAAGGRNSSVLPYFNVRGDRGGAVAAVGWTGQWYASLRQTKDGVRFKAKQQTFRAALMPGEEVRSPMISLTFYDGRSALKGFNSFRNTQLDCLFSGDLKPMRGYVFANEFCTLSCDELIKKVKSTDKKVLDSIDHFWMDAGWYEYDEEWYDGVGNWTPDKERFPDKLKPLSDAIKETGKSFLLWYEPERVREGTALAKEGEKHDSWTIRDKENVMWNLADDDACAFLTDLISSSLIENGVGIYRQDFNFDPLSYWRKADRELYGGRKGICENRYVTNLYRYLDELTERVDGLVIDNCASGGRRIDIEMCRRSVPLWRSDYSCVSADGKPNEGLYEATQDMTLGLSCWLPFSGTMQYFESSYAARSAVLTHPAISDPEGSGSYDSVRRNMTENFFPLRTDGKDGENAAMQFGTGRSGSVLLYARGGGPDVCRVKLNGLFPDGTYTLTDEDDPGHSLTMSGKELMETGAQIKTENRPAAFILHYRTAG